MKTLQRLWKTAAKLLKGDFAIIQPTKCTLSLQLHRLELFPTRSVMGFQRREGVDIHSISYPPFHPHQWTECYDRKFWATVNLATPLFPAFNSRSSPCRNAWNCNLKSVPRLRCFRQWQTSCYFLPFFIAFTKICHYVSCWEQVTRIKINVRFLIIFLTSDEHEFQLMSLLLQIVFCQSFPASNSIRNSDRHWRSSI